MPLRARAMNGFSMIELLVVLIIVGVLTAAGVGMIGNRSGGSVRGVLDELEGGLLEAQIAAGATGKDVQIVTWGGWNDADPLRMARGSAALTSAEVKALATNMLHNPPVMPTTALGKTVGTPFIYRNTREYQYGGVVVKGSTWGTDALGAGEGGRKNQDIASVVPFSDDKDTSFGLALGADNNLFSNAVKSISISGTSRRFNNTFFIQVVGLRNGNAMPGGPMGLIVVQANGASIFKFYNSGSNKGDGQWRRI